MCFSSVFAQEPRKVVEKFFPDPDVEINIPSLQKKRGFTTYKEMLKFLNDEIKRYPNLISMKMVGKTQQKKEIPLITIEKNNGVKDKIKVFYVGRVHGDEPSGTEALLYFTQQITKKPDLKPLLDKVVFYIMPMVNIDGGEDLIRATHNHIDMNRDQSKLDTPETRVLHKVVNEAQPHIFVDYHEYQPMRSDFSRISSDVLSTPWDVMFLYSGNPNVPKALRDAVDNIFLPAAAKLLDKNGMTHHTYYSSKRNFGEVSITVGGSSPRSTSNAMALKNMISLLMETRGIKLGKSSLKRRVYGAYLTAEAFSKIAYNQGDEIRKILKEAREDKTDIAIKYKPLEVKNYTFPFIDIIKNEKTTLNINARFSSKSYPVKTRPIPKAYYILPNEKRAIEVLKIMGIEMTQLSESKTINAETFTITETKDGQRKVGGVYPLKIKAKIEKKEINLPKGTYRVDSNQKSVRAATVLLEPESSNGFVNYRVIKVEKNKQVPVYRELF